MATETVGFYLKLPKDFKAAMDDLAELEGKTLTRVIELALYNYGVLRAAQISKEYAATDKGMAVVRKELAEDGDWRRFSEIFGIIEKAEFEEEMKSYAAVIKRQAKKRDEYNTVAARLAQAAAIDTDEDG